jgi:ABC-2 type transport system permease protein
MLNLLKFELGAYFKKPGIYIVFILLLAAGFFIGLKMSFSAGNDIYRNAPYSIANMVGLLSITGIFFTTMFASQMLLKERDARFDVILYATPITKVKYLFSRFGALFGLTTICFTLLITGYMAGQFADEDQVLYRTFNLWYYVQSVAVIALPNLLLCAVLECSVAWLTRSKFMIFISGLFIYIGYLVILTYSGSPMMTDGLPQSPESLELAAKVDPFGLSAFYQQTNLWTVAQKNNTPIQLTGNLLLNRLVYITISLALLLAVYFKFNLRLNVRGQAKNKLVQPEDDSVLPYQPLATNTEDTGYVKTVLTSLVKQNIVVVVKSIAFTIITLGLVFYMCMEFYGSIDQGIRLPEQYASTGLIANRILYNLPGLLLLVVLFYAHELYWRSTDHRFHWIENSTPVSKACLLLSKWITLALMIILLITVIIFTGIAFQFVYQYARIGWQVYGMLYWLIGLPLMMCAGAMLLIQRLINRKWLGLILSVILMVLLVTSAGKSLGITHPLLRFMAAYAARYSEMNGWDDCLTSFSWRMLYGASLITLAWLMMSYRLKRLTKIQALCFLLPLGLSLCTGIYILKKAPSVTPGQQLDKQENYERNYRKLSRINQPVVTHVQTKIDLDPDNNAYQVWGKYMLKNKGKTPVKELLVNFDEGISVKAVGYHAGGHAQSVNTHTDHVKLQSALMPGDSATLTFSFTYRWNGFTGHQPFNAIVHNGTFLRISNYFPRLGYQKDREISSPAERRKRQLGKATPITLLEAARGTNEFIDLDMTVSVPQGQSVIGIGKLARQWNSDNRNYYRYLSGMPIPFRFGLSAASYQIKKVPYKGVEIAVYYDSRHPENVAHLIRNAARTLDYCHANFGPYPYKTIRFAEVSSFTDGFAGTAYPATIFMTEHMLFHDNLHADQGQDVINELAAHELSHQWWGNAQLAPDEREGSKILIETLAMYTELMLAKHYLGKHAVAEKLAVHQGIYLSERGFSKEPPLYKVRPEDSHLYYDKGLLVMHQVSELLGEDKTNKALKNLLLEHRYPGPAPLSTDLITELCRVSTIEQQERIKKLFMH